MGKRISFIELIISTIIFITIEVCSIVMITNNGIVQNYMIVGWINSVRSVAWSVNQEIRSYFNLRGVNETLREENAQLKSELARFQNYYSDKDTLIMSQEGRFDYLPATIIKSTTNSQHNYLIIDKGHLDGVSAGMGVISNRGVVGIVNHTSKNYSYVISLMNHNQNVSAKIAGSNYYGPMRWDGYSRNGAHLEELPPHTTMAIGDTICTSGLSAIYPSDIPLGRAVSIRSVNGISKTINVELFQDFKMLQYVYVVVDRDADKIRDIQRVYEE